jgi:CheY-like chemotaxis protein
MYRNPVQPPEVTLEPGQLPLLVLEDGDEDMLLFERVFRMSRFKVIPASTAATAEAALARIRPAAIVLDLRLHGHDSWDVLARWKREAATASIPLVVVSSLDDPQKAYALGADAFARKPVDREWLLRTLDSLVPGRGIRVLTVDDEEAFRFIVRGFLRAPDFHVVEAASGMEALRCAADLSPDVILLDVRMAAMDGLEVHARLKENPATSAIPVVILTEGRLTADERERLGGTAVLSKSGLGRDTLQSAIRAALAEGERSRLLA